MTPAPSPAPARVVHVFYGTETGNAEEIARRISAETPGALPAQSLRNAGSGVPFAGPAPGVAVVVVSTTGDGDPPEKIRPFMRFARNAAKAPASLAHLSYALLGLGDTNYENFCNTAKKLDVAFGKAGATPVVPRGLADDGTGLEHVVEPWLAALPAALDKYFASVGALAAAPGAPGTVAAAPAAAPAAALSPVEAAIRAVTARELGLDVPAALPPALAVRAVDAPPASGAVSPFHSAAALRTTVSGARLLTPDGAARRVYHAELDVGGGLSYAPGDAFGVLVENAARDVDRAVARVARADGARDRARVFEVTGVADGGVVAAATARALLAQRVDLRCVPKKSLLRALADYCGERDDREALLRLCARRATKPAPPGAPAYTADVVLPARGVLDVLDAFAPTCRPPLAVLLDLLPPLAPRYYSAACAPEAHPGQLHFAFSVVRDGLATPMLADLCDAVLGGGDGGAMHVVPRAEDAASVFRPPESVSTPYIMIGPGTGVAPFRGFLQSRAAQLAAQPDTARGETMLFFGCRGEHVDFLYRDELRAFERDGVLDVLDVAFSRDGPSKVYVQDRLMKRGEEVAASLEKGASVFVCGDGGGMAMGVDKALHHIVASHICGGDEDAAKAYVKALAADKRYVRDIWYFGTVAEE